MRGCSVRIVKDILEFVKTYISVDAILQYMGFNFYRVNEYSKPFLLVQLLCARLKFLSWWRKRGKPLPIRIALSHTHRTNIQFYIQES